MPGSSAGGQALLAKYGREYFVELGRRGAAARKANLRTNIIVSLNSLLGEIAEKARTNASWSNRIPDAIKVGEIIEKDGNFYGTIILDKNVAPEAAAFEYGSGLHATKEPPHLIPIAAKNAPNLVFWWAKGGKLFVGPRLPIGHPGVEAKPYLHPAIDEHRDEMKRTLASAFKRAFVDVGVTEITVSV